jgi:hypothetical protein
LPLIKSHTSRSLRGEMRTNLVLALASIALSTFC